MRKIITVFILLFCFNTYSQKDKRLNDLIVLALNQAIDTTRIYNIRNIIASEKGLYNHLFDYVPSINPLNPKRLKHITSKISTQSGSSEKNNSHSGLFFLANNGTAIHATASGKVVKVKSSENGNANQVIIKHDYGFTTSYAQMYKFIVKKGDLITKGQVIGFVNNNKSNKAPILHYEILKNNKGIDTYPFCFLNLQEDDRREIKNFKSAPFDPDIDTFLSQIKKNVF